MRLYIAALGIGAGLLGAAPAFGAGSGGDDAKPMTAAELVAYQNARAEAKAQWARLTPAQRAATLATARTRRLADLTAMERYGQNDDMLRETARQSAALQAEAAAAQATWAQLSPLQREALRQSAWQKKRAELTALEKAGQRNDVDPDVIP